MPLETDGNLAKFIRDHSEKANLVPQKYAESKLDVLGRKEFSCDAAKPRMKEEEAEIVEEEADPTLQSLQI